MHRESSTREGSGEAVALEQGAEGGAFAKASKASLLGAASSMRMPSSARRQM